MPKTKCDAAKEPTINNFYKFYKRQFFNMFNAFERDTILCARIFFFNKNYIVQMEDKTIYFVVQTKYNLEQKQ